MDSPTVTYCHIHSLCYEYGLIYSDIYTPSLQSFSTITPILPFLSLTLLFSQMFLIVQRSPISQYAVLVYCAALMDGSVIIIINKHLENRIQKTSRRCKCLQKEVACTRRDEKIISHKFCFVLISFHHANPHGFCLYLLLSHVSFR